MSTRMTFTLVQHTGFTVGGKMTFQRAVEERQVTSAKERKVIAGAGGLLLESYAEAHDRAEKENYPEGVEGIVPQAKGKFVKRKGFDEPIYIPA